MSSARVAGVGARPRDEERDLRRSDLAVAYVKSRVPSLHPVALQFVEGALGTLGELRVSPRRAETVDSDQTGAVFAELVYLGERDAGVTRNRRLAEQGEQQIAEAVAAVEARKAQEVLTQKRACYTQTIPDNAEDTAEKKAARERIERETKLLQATAPKWAYSGDGWFLDQATGMTVAGERHDVEIVVLLGPVRPQAVKSWFATQWNTYCRTSKILLLDVPEIPSDLSAWLDRQGIPVRRLGAGFEAYLKTQRPVVAVPEL